MAWLNVEGSVELMGAVYADAGAREGAEASEVGGQGL